MATKNVNIDIIAKDKTRQAMQSATKGVDGLKSAVFNLRNALIGTVTQIGLIFGILLAGTVVVESVFDWPGLGLYAVQSILNSDYNAIMGFTLITGALFIIINLIVDIIQGIIDPRSQE